MTFIEWGWRTKRLRSIARHLTHFDLQQPDEDSETLSEIELEDSLITHHPHHSLFLNFYTRTGLIEALERYGTFSRLRERGFDPQLYLKLIDNDRHMLRICDGEAGPVLIELVSRLATLKVKEAHPGLKKGTFFDLLAIEWLLLQNPHAQFTKARPRLPGQHAPGLGIGREILTLLEIMSERLERLGLMAIPQHYHNGLLYDRRFRFFSPSKEGELKALEQALSGLSLAQASWAVENRLVIDKKTNLPYQWQGEEMIWSKLPPLADYFVSDYYQNETAQVMAKREFIFDYEKLDQLMIEVNSIHMK